MRKPTTEDKSLGTTDSLTTEAAGDTSSSRDSAVLVTVSDRGWDSGDRVMLCSLPKMRFFHLTLSGEYNTETGRFVLEQ